jgi:hypothetical protein
MPATRWASLAGPVLCALVVAAAAAAARDPQAMVLRRSDIPSGFSVQSQGYESVRRAAAGSPFTVAQYEAWGYLRYYEVDYELAGAGTKVLTGPLEIASSASVYKTAAGAAASFAASRAQCPKHGRLFSTTARIGDGSFGCEYATSKSGVPVVAYVLTWHRGPVKAGIVVDGLRTAVSATRAVGLARLEDARIRA